jgi:hypothetical protein
MECNVADHVSIYVPSLKYIHIVIIYVCQTDRKYRNSIEACLHCRIYNKWCPALQHECTIIKQGRGTVSPDRNQHY